METESESSLKHLTKHTKRIILLELNQLRNKMHKGESIFPQSFARKPISSSSIRFPLEKQMPKLEQPFFHSCLWERLSSV